MSVDPMFASTSSLPPLPYDSSMSPDVVAVLVAGGLGVRYGGPTPKPALRLTGKALIALSVEAMAAGGCEAAVVVLNSTTTHHFAEAFNGSPIPVFQTLGGQSRQESVLNGLEFIQHEPSLASASVVLIHDAVRPMVPATVVQDVIDAVRGGAQAVTPVIPLADSIRMVGEDESTSSVIDRSRLRAIQTPQGFPMQVVCDAHAQMAAEGKEFTDDVSCVEAAGHPVTLVPGSRLAMKITEPTDLTIAEALWKIRSSIGHHSGRRITRHLRRE